MFSPATIRKIDLTLGVIGLGSMLILIWDSGYPNILSVWLLRICALFYGTFMVRLIWPVLNK